MLRESNAARSGWQEAEGTADRVRMPPMGVTRSPTVAYDAGRTAARNRTAQAATCRSLVGDARPSEGAGQELPMRIPARKTMTPPTTTCMVAERKGVSMYRLRIQAMATSSTATTMEATMVAVRKCGIK